MLAYVVPRFSAVAFCSVLLLIGTGIGQSLLELPTLASLWQTSYGQALLWKIGLLAAALAARGRQPRADEAAAPGRATASAPLLLRRLVQGEIVFVAAALFAAAVLSSLAPPSSALAESRTSPPASGPGRCRETVVEGAVQAARARDAEPRGRPERVLAHAHARRTSRCAAPR